jgi:hypothetical protein
MFSIDSEDFLNNLLSFDFNTTKHISFICFAYFWLPGTFQTSNRPKIFHIIFLGNKTPCAEEEEEVNGERNEAQKRAHHVWHNPGRMVGHISGLVCHFNVILISTNYSWPKTKYIKDPSGDFMTGRQRNTEYTKLIWDCKDRRGYAAGATPGCLFDSIDTISCSNMMKRG